jgi:hypothetical protein
MKPFITIALALFLVGGVAHAAELKVGANLETKININSRDARATGTATGTNATGTRADIKADIEARQASNTERRINFQIDIAERLATNVGRVLTATVTRLERIIDRIESRIEKIEARGGSTTEAEASIEAAEKNLVDAKASINLLTSLDLNGEKAQENFAAVRSAAKEAKSHIRLAHENLMKAVRSLMSASAKVEAEGDVEVE